MVCTKKVEKGGVGQWGVQRWDKLVGGMVLDSGGIEPVFGGKSCVSR